MSSSEQQQSGDAAAAPPQLAAPATRDTLIGYIERISQVFLLDASSMAAVSAALRGVDKQLDTFIGDAKHPSLAVQCIPPPTAAATDNDKDAIDVATAQVALEVRAFKRLCEIKKQISPQPTQVSFADPRAQTLVFIKRASDGVLLSQDAHGNALPLSSQLQVVRFFFFLCVCFFQQFIVQFRSIITIHKQTNLHIYS
jgi:hypothetical protein